MRLLMPERIRLRECSGDFLTRRQGEELRAKLVGWHEHLSSDDRLVIDFGGVDVMTPSFADECFGKFAERIGFANFLQTISLVGAEETIRVLINSVLAGREAKTDSDGNGRTTGRKRA